MEISQNLRQSIFNYKAGDKNAFTAIYEETQKYVYACIYKVMNGNDNAYDATMDIMSETFFEISQSIYSLNDIEKFYSWAGTIATRKCYDYIKKNKKYVLMPEEEEGFDDMADDDNIIPESIYQDKEKQRLLREIIDNNLSEMQKICVIGYYYNEQKVSEIAAYLNLPEGTIKTNLFRAKAKIKEGVLSLEKSHGTRLYSATPLLVALFAEEVITSMVPYQLSCQVFSNVCTSMAAGVMVGGTMATSTPGMAGATQFGYVADNAVANLDAIPFGNVADNVAENIATQGMSGGIAKAGAAEGAKSALTGIGGKLAAMSLKAKLVGGALALVTVGGVGVIAHNVTHEDKDDTSKKQDITTEATITEEIITEAIITEATTEATTEVATEAPVEEVEVSEEELLALTTLALNLTATEWGSELNGTTLEIEDAIVWEFVGRMNNNAQYDGVETQYMPVSAGVNVYSKEAMTQYAYDVFGLETLEYTSNYWFYDKGDGTYSLSGAQIGDTDKCVLKSIHIDGDTYTVTGVNSWGEYTDINQTEPTYSANRTYEFTMVVTKNSDSPFGFRVVSMSYVYGDVFDIGITEPPVITVGEGGVTETNSSSVDVKAQVIDPNTTDPTMLKYLEIIDGVCNKNVWPDGTTIDSSNITDLSENDYGVIDLDGDGRKELVISIENTSSANQGLRIYDYNAQTDELKLQLMSWYKIEVYENGTIILPNQYNDSYSMKIWPYELCVYDEKTDMYEVIAIVEGWEKQYHGDGFPADYDGDGLVYNIDYYVNTYASEPYYTYVDNVGFSTYMHEQEYNEWFDQYVDTSEQLLEILAEPMNNVLNN
ncbi:MAG: sigma-70 family RNA polymerase sigma factor [Lachnospiraceae bacterium]|nr:sigma-70 family RNA polymerase sigma factor [Lachnospiraceae bacterium]